MTPTLDREWESWTEAWRAGAAPEPDLHARLREHVRRRGRRLVLLAVLEGVLAAAMLSLATIVAVRRTDPPALVWAAAVWAFTLLAWGFSTWNRRGAWKPAGGTTRSFLDLSVARCRRQIRMVRFGWALMAAEILFLIAWGWWEARTVAARPGAPPGNRLIAYGLIGLFALGCAGWLVWLRRRAVRELRSLEETRRRLDVLEGPGGP